MVKPANKGKVRVKQDADYIFHELTRSICPECKTVIDAQILIQDNKVLMRKRCPTQRLDASSEIIKILEEIQGKLAAFLAFPRMSGAPPGEGQLERSPELVAKVRDTVTAGELGYWLFVGEKRG